MSDEDNLIQFLERREIKVNRESEGYTVRTTRTSLDSEELEHIISLGRIFAMNVDYDLIGLYIGIKKKANIQDSDEKRKKYDRSCELFLIEDSFVPVYTTCDRYKRE